MMKFTIFLFLIVVISSVSADKSFCRSKPTSEKKRPKIWDTIREWFQGRPIPNIQTAEDAMIEAIIKDSKNPHNPCEDPKKWLCCHFSQRMLNTYPFDAITYRLDTCCMYPSESFFFWFSIRDVS